MLMIHMTSRYLKLLRFFSYRLHISFTIIMTSNFKYSTFFFLDSFDFNLYYNNSTKSLESSAYYDFTLYCKNLFYYSFVISLFETRVFNFVSLNLFLAYIPLELCFLLDLFKPRKSLNGLYLLFLLLFLFY